MSDLLEFHLLRHIAVIAEVANFTGTTQSVAVGQEIPLLRDSPRSSRKILHFQANLTTLPTWNVS
jgi:hypothetical protein